MGYPTSILHTVVECDHVRKRELATVGIRGLADDTQELAAHTRMLQGLEPNDKIKSLLGGLRCLYLHKHCSPGCLPHWRPSIAPVAPAHSSEWLGLLSLTATATRCSRALRLSLWPREPQLPSNLLPPRLPCIGMPALTTVVCLRPSVLEMAAAVLGFGLHEMTLFRAIEYAQTSWEEPLDLEQKPHLLLGVSGRILDSGKHRVTYSTLKQARKRESEFCGRGGGETCVW